MRVEGWEENLTQYLGKRAAMPFKWGKNDCCLFAAGAVKAITGHDFGVIFEHTNKREAYEYIKKFGGVDKIADSFLDEKEINYLCRGDVAMVDVGRPALGVHIGDYVVIAGKRGIELCPLQNIKKGWSVGSCRS